MTLKTVLSSLPVVGYMFSFRVLLRYGLHTLW